MSKKTIGCPVEITLQVIGGRWKVMLIHELLEGTRRFSELHRAMKNISHRTLTQQLRDMEEHGLVHRKVYQQVPPKVEYTLTPLGKSLQPVLMSMQDWATKHGSRIKIAKPSSTRAMTTVTR